MQHEKSILERLKAVEERIVELEQLMGTPSRPFPVTESESAGEESPDLSAAGAAGSGTLQVNRPQPPELEASEEAIAAVRGDLAIGALAVPRKIVDGKLHVTALTPFDKAVLEKIGEECGLEIVPEAGDMQQIIEALSFYYEDVRSNSDAAKQDAETSAESGESAESSEDVIAEGSALGSFEDDLEQPAA